MAIYLGPEKADRLSQIFHSIQTIFDRDPGVKPNGMKYGKNLVVVVHAFTDDAVREATGIA
jgi:hypothetical protein